MDCQEIILTLPAEQIDLASDIAQMAAPYGMYIEDYRNLEQDVNDIAHIDLIDEELLAKDRSKGLIHIYLSMEDNPAEALAFLKERFGAEGIAVTTEERTCLEADWANNWKKYFKPLPIGEKLLIQPVWEKECNAGGRHVLYIEPGMAFGTGAHETTRLCLELLERYVRPGITMLDIGCGSGILSVAALLLGAHRATGVDIDAMAARTAVENAQLNHVADRFEGITGSLTDQVHGQFDLVAANIVADIILALNQDVGDFLVPGAVYLMSGIIDTREDEVLASLEGKFEVLEILRERGWVAIAARAPEHQPS